MKITDKQKEKGYSECLSVIMEYLLPFNSMAIKALYDCDEVLRKTIYYNIPFIERGGKIYAPKEGELANKKIKKTCVAEYIVRCKQNSERRENEICRIYGRRRSLILDFLDLTDAHFQKHVNQLYFQIKNVLKKNGIETDIELKSKVIGTFVLLQGAKDFFVGVCKQFKEKYNYDFSKMVAFANLYSLYSLWDMVVRIVTFGDKNIDFGAYNQCMTAYNIIEKNVVDEKIIGDMLLKATLENKNFRDDCKEAISELYKDSKNQKEVLEIEEKWMQRLVLG